MKTPLSLKGRALQLLAQREHSRLELRRKLLRRLRDARREADGNPPDSESAGNAGSRDSLDPEIEVDTLLDWLLAHRYLSDERFVESRVHARSARYGNLRIRRELSQHGVGLTPDLAGNLRNSEQARAVEVRQRKFGGPPATLTERARQARFLTARGFSSDVVRQVLRTSGQRDEDLDARHLQEAPVNDEAD
jgi:regulatory protein